MRSLSGQHSRCDDVHGHAPFLTWNTLLRNLARTARCPTLTRLSGETGSFQSETRLTGPPASCACIGSPMLNVISGLARPHDRLHGNRLRPTVPARIRPLNAHRYDLPDHLPVRPSDCGTSLERSRLSVFSLTAVREVGRVVHGSELGQRNRGRQWRSPPLSLQDSHRTERGAPPPPQVYGAARVRSGTPGQERRLRRPDKTPACEIVELQNVARSLGRSTAQNSARRRSPLAVAPHSTLIIRRMMLDKPGVSRDAGALDFPPKTFRRIRISSRSITRKVFQLLLANASRHMRHGLSRAPGA